jgi:glutathione reductase (NADPH)
VAETDQSEKFDYDFFVIGAGSGGVRAARTAAALGARTAIAEARFFGGTCVNVGCIPKKLYTYAAHVSKDITIGQAYGWSFSTQPEFNWALLKQNKDLEINRLNSIYENLLTQAGVAIYNGRAALLAPHTVRVNDSVIRARHILLAVGGKPRVPAIPGIELAINSDDFFELNHQPAAVAIVGGGFIATELASVFHGLGTEVTLIHRGEQLLNGFDHDIRQFCTEEMHRKIDMRLGSEVLSITRRADDDAGVRVTLADHSLLDVDQILFATGRSPATESLGLEQAGVNTSQSGAILVDDSFATNVAGIYAVGDVIERVTLTPVALAEGQALANRLFGGPAKAISYDMIPSAVFCDPQVATVGLTEQAALERYRKIIIYKSRFRPLKYTMGRHEHFTLMKMIVDPASDRVVGLHMAGDDAAEIVQGMAVAMMAGATKTHFDATLGIHPSAAEEFVTMRTAAGTRSL